MTLAQPDTPLRRSEVESYREMTQNNITINDDEEERRENRRRTLQSTVTTDTSTLEESETLKKCLEIYNGNKLSKDNAWSLSLIDTLSTLLDRHHKSLNNFKVAGSSLEASSKVYGLRVDSIHVDAMRLSAGLNAQKFAERNIDDDEDSVATGGDGAAGPSDTAAGTTDAAVQAKQKPKRQRKAVSTITKNKETLNARLDTVPLQDPVFGKLNSAVASINSSNRLMNNILITSDAELRLHANFKLWDSKELDDLNFTDAVPLTEEAASLASCDRLLRLKNVEQLSIRALHGAYVITDTPEVIADEKELSRRLSSDTNFDNDAGMDVGEMNEKELSMAFDINADCEPMPELDAQPQMVDVDYDDLDELTTEERSAIGNCRALRRAPVQLEDLRPIDSSSKLEYSYRPLDKISQFWAGPSHWKFKRNRTRPSVRFSDVPHNNRGAAQRQSKRSILKRHTYLDFTNYHDELFLKINDSSFKVRKVNYQKKWDQRKLKLPTDFQCSHNMFDCFANAPGLHMEDRYSDDAHTNVNSNNNVDDDMMGGDNFDDHFADNSDQHINITTNAQTQTDNLLQDDHNMSANIENDLNNPNETILEISTHFDGAPTQVTKVVVPFAKRAKVIDMKNLKRSCFHLLNKQILNILPAASISLQHPTLTGEAYKPGFASFSDMYKHLPEILTPAMIEALSPSVAFYSVLHLANEHNLRLIPQNDLEDFKVRQLEK